MLRLVYKNITHKIQMVWWYIMNI